ncbi:MAG: peroxiredoxin [Thermoplasmatales archaeon]
MTEIREGDAAPDFDVPGFNGRKKLSDYRGKVVVIYFYPKDFTPGCTTEACEFRDSYPDFKSKGIEVFGISVDSENSHKRFAEKYALPFLLVPDHSKEIASKYGVLGETSAKRVTFIIGKDGKVAFKFPKVSPKNHAKEVLSKVTELGLLA